MFKLKKRCLRCLHILRDDGTCQNPKCVRYTEAEGKKTDTSTGEKGGDDYNAQISDNHSRPADADAYSKRDDGTCPNVKCVRYKPESTTTTEDKKERR